MIIEKASVANRKKGFDYQLLLETPVFVKEVSKFLLISELSEERMEFNGEKVSLLYTKNLFCDKMKFNLNGFHFRTRRNGDFIELQNLGKKKVNDFFTDKKYLPSKRDEIPLLAIESNVLQIYEVRDSIYIESKTEKANLLFQVYEKI